VSAPDHDRWADSTAAYLLGALPDDEVAGFERHLETCAACRRELDELRVAADALPASAPPVTPPAALKTRIMAVVESEAELLSAAGEGADRPAAAATPAPRRRRGWLGGLLARPAPAAALAALLLLAGGVGGAVLAGGGSEGARTITALVNRAAAPDARVSLEVDGDGRGVLVGRDLPPPPRGRIYQVWLLRPGARAPEPTPALFGVSTDGSAAVAVPGDLDGVEQVLVTHEPLGGSRAPTRAPILSVPTTT
jgi:anti-sigma-K factor RskA